MPNKIQNRVEKIYLFYRFLLVTFTTVLSFQFTVSRYGKNRETGLIPVLPRNCKEHNFVTECHCRTDIIDGKALQKF